MSYYWFDREKLLNKARDNYNNDESKKTTKYYTAKIPCF